MTVCDGETEADCGGEITGATVKHHESVYLFVASWLAGWLARVNF